VALLAVTPTGHWLEFVDWADPILDEPVEIRDGQAMPSARSGIGMKWNEKAVKRFAA
jgi:mandelate racemase